MNPLPTDPPLKPRNSFQLLVGILAAAVGISSHRERARTFAQASMLTILGAVLIFLGAVFAGLTLFVHLIKAP